MKNFLAKILIVLTLTGNLLASLPDSSPKINISGKIIDWIYREPVRYQIYWPSRSTTVNAKGHYLLLIDEQVLDNKVIEKTNSYVRNLQFQDPFIYDALNGNDRQKKYLVIPLCAKYDSLFAIGSEITISDYSILRDGANYDTPHKELRIKPRLKSNK